MRTTKQLLENNNKVWIYFSSDEAKDAFYEDAASTDIRLHFSKGEFVKRENIGTLMSLSANGEMAYVSMMVWNYSFLSPQSGIDPISHEMIRNHPKIDYAKFTAGDNDYFINKNPFRPATPQEIADHEANNANR